MPHSNDDLIQEWLAKAEDDIVTVRTMNKLHPELTGVIATHCQQAIEKCLKALFVWEEIDIPRIHDLEELVLQLHGAFSATEELMTKLDVITEYAVSTRYPGSPNPSRAATIEAIEVAELIYADLRKQFPKQTEN